MRKCPRIEKNDKYGLISPNIIYYSIYKNFKELIFSFPKIFIFAIFFVPLQ